MKDIINEELNYMKYLFGYKKGVVISEQTEGQIQNDDQYFNLLKTNGFKVPTDEEAKEFFAPSIFTMSRYTFVYINPETKGFTYKVKDGVFRVGYKSTFSPIENKDYPSVNDDISYPIKPEIISKYITNPRKVDKTWDLNSIIRSLDSIRNVWGPEPPTYPEGFIVLKNNQPVVAGTDKPLDQTIKNKINKTAKEQLAAARKNLQTIPDEEKQKQVTSFKFGNTYDNVNTYLDSVEQEGKNLKLIS
jgi:hypothetical protein